MVLNHLDGFHPVDAPFDDVFDVHMGAGEHLPHWDALRLSVVEWWLVRLKNIRPSSKAAT